MYGGNRSDLRPMTEDCAKRWVQRLLDQDYAWIIEAGGLIGEIRLDRVDFRDKRASLAVGIEDASQLGKGLGSEAIALALGYAFNVLKLHRVSVRVLAYNSRAIRAYQKCGFVIEGREREAAFVDGAWHDDVMMAILDSEYLGRDMPQAIFAGSPPGTEVASVRVSPIKVREMLSRDARMYLEVHHAAVRGIAARDYPPEVIEHWAPMPVTDESVRRFLVNPDEEILLVAEIDGVIVGIGSLVVANCELRACYVAPAAARKGVGSALLREIEHIARDHGLAYLQMDSSITAEPFYLHHGYSVRQRGEHTMRPSGRTMACVKMEKFLK